jgi:hypothetical protein
MTIPPSEEPKFSGSPNKPEDPTPRKKIEPRIALKKGTKADDLLGFAKENTKDTIAYIFLIVGFLLLFFEPLYGGTILGVLLGLYFTVEFVDFWKNANEWIEEWGMVKTLVLAAVLLSFFVSSIGAAVIMIVTAITVVLKYLFLPDIIASIHKNDKEL